MELVALTFAIVGILIYGVVAEVAALVSDIRMSRMWRKMKKDRR